MESEERKFGFVKEFRHPLEWFELGNGLFGWIENESGISGIVIAVEFVGRELILGTS